jgi:hypothetical protein
VIRTNLTLYIKTKGDIKLHGSLELLEVQFKHVPPPWSRQIHRLVEECYALFPMARVTHGDNDSAQDCGITMRIFCQEQERDFRARFKPVRSVCDHFGLCFLKETKEKGESVVCFGIKERGKKGEH